MLMQRDAGVLAQFPDALFKDMQWADSTASVLGQAAAAAQLIQAVKAA